MRYAAVPPGWPRAARPLRRRSVRPDHTVFPRSYVIPTGPGQHSEPAAARLVDLLIGSGGRVWRAKHDFRAGGRSYRAGSYVVDLHQPKRGLVNSLLEPGADITDRVNDLYAGPAAWSQGLTWGATVDRSGTGCRTYS
ncbi:hypothetical protein [Micromonospora narathiwatensis]|uniref:hypothetical protein n=1 Tax=Micromonospora narathiwatensis TaxID=299146 RepID=UPI000AF6519A|nr:hypothetical protein [Micromonospora narathiwatensis]